MANDAAMNINNVYIKIELTDEGQKIYWSKSPVVMMPLEVLIQTFGYEMQCGIKCFSDDVEIVFTDNEDEL